MKTFRPRRKLIVNREVQFDVVMHVSLFVAVLFLGQIIAAYLFIGKIQELAGTGAFSLMSVSEFIARYKTVFLVYQLIPVLIGLVVGFWYFNRMTRRIVGPLFNIKRTVKRMADENLDSVEIHLRENDYFQDLAQDINVVLQKKTK
ncbi:HAMP domain-containing protein [Bdellovibrio bacteriovorus]|uniref:HAMP domain-containing protein n=1 Tax=Bdellovibrio bacteriovorus TaxID=959 RepID=UPI0021D035F0|nr:HAMP domain-containing protein [Bdellovibrio bacteriovorus]UXR64580.1 HAMP domain-containing protein [Bdellovibrio bacteriovorus]